MKTLNENQIKLKEKPKVYCQVLELLEEIRSYQNTYLKKRFEP